MGKHKYNEYPRGCRFSTNTTKHMVPVALEDIAAKGTRAQRRYAARELRRLKNKSVVKRGD